MSVPKARRSLDVLRALADEDPPVCAPRLTVSGGTVADAAENLPRFATHLEMHQGLMLSRSGDRAGGVAHARAALNALPPEKHSLTLRMLLAEVEHG